MGQSQAAAGAASMDRLPWLADDPAPPAKRGQRNLLGWIAGAALLIATSSYWLGTNGADLPDVPRATPPTTTVALPPPQSLQPVQPLQSAVPQVKLERVPEVEPIVAPPMPVVDVPRAVRRPLLKTAPAVQPTDEVTETQPNPVSAAPADPLALWPVRMVEGASGRLVRIGTFATAHKAKKGWWAIVRMNPALKRLPALVVPVRSLRDGRTYYRLQMGTSSPAHSTVLCQRMRMIAQSCVVIGVGEGGANGGATEPSK